MVQLSGSEAWIVRDVTDINHPFTVATIPSSVHTPALVTDTEMSYLNSQGPVRSPFSGSPQAVVAPFCIDGAPISAWSRDAQSMLWVQEIEPSPTTPGVFKWHLVRSGVDKILGSSITGCHCDGGGGAFTGFSTDGGLAFLDVSHGAGNQTEMQVRKLDGTLVGDELHSADFPIWSGSTLYFHDSNGISAWQDGTVKPFLPGVDWSNPQASPAGGSIVFTVVGNDKLPRVQMVDTATGKTTQLGSRPAALPVFLNARYVWYDEVQSCFGITCYLPGAQPTGNTYIYDLQTGTESASAIKAVGDTWPHGV